MQRIVFERASSRASYSHFIEASGDTIAFASLVELREVRVGVVFFAEFPSDAQRQAIAHLANLATGVDPTVEIVFSAGTSPFPGGVLANHPFADLCSS
ncbi:hypothetical protein [Bradyrhizobium diazoefficiens]